MAAGAPLKHEVALLGDEKIFAPELRLACGGNREHPEARRVVEASRKRLLRCAVCGALVRRMFGPEKRWHFAVLPGEAPCDHENETVEHHEAKLALFDAMFVALPPGWGVELEKRLPNGRRSDVLATRESDGLHVAFEVQYADLSETEWRERHEDYLKLGVRDVWLLGRSRQGRTRDALAGTLAAEEGQRVVYVGRRMSRQDADPALKLPEPEEAEGAARAEELLFADGAFLGEARLLRPGSPAPEAFGRKTLSRGSWLRRAHHVGYGLGEIRLLADGTLRTPADAAYEEARARYEGRRRSALGLPQKAQRQATSPPTPRGIGEPPTTDPEAWRTSAEQAAAVVKIGGALVALLEREGTWDRALLAEPGRWKTRFFLEHIEGRMGRPLDYHEAAGGVMRLLRRKGEIAPAWSALADFRELLAAEGFIRFVRDDKGMERHWRVVRDSTSWRR